MKIKHQICPLALGQLYFHSSGTVYPCGFLQGKLELGNVKDSSIEDIWRGEAAREFREEHLRGGCNQCREMQGKYNCHLLHSNIPINEQSKIKRLDIMIDSFCNLKCIMCTNRSEINQGFVHENFWTELEKNILPCVEEIELVGGEPFISKDTYRLIDLVKNINPSIRWCFTTNGHFDFDQLLKSRLQGLNIYSFAVSIDSFDEKKFSYIRPNGNLEKAKETLLKLDSARKEFARGFYLSCNFLVQKENYDEIEVAIDYGESVGIPVYFILLREPEEFSILTLGEDKLIEIIKEYLHIAKKRESIKILNLALKLIKELKGEARAEVMNIFLSAKESLAVEK